YGTKKVRDRLVKRLRYNSPRWDLCITSYETCRALKGQLRQIYWNFVALDEGHKIKNENSHTHQATSAIKSHHRLILTGTQLNNNLHELWALLSYLVPDFFSNAHDFDTWFDSDDCLRGNDEIVKRLHLILQPFMLHRVKSEVLKSLLPKKEIKLYIPMTKLQLETYINVLLKDVKSIDAFGEISKKSIKAIVMELRKEANHPYLIDGVEPGPPYTTDQHIVDSCGKMIVLEKFLAKLKSEGSRVVLFSQFVINLNILEDYLVWKGYEFRRLDGQTPVEQRVIDIDSFNAENSKIFIYLISTRAGGL
ncbi:putative global transcription activator SNF2L1, partial [Pseudolycoriella hygida]